MNYTPSKQLIKNTKQFLNLKLYTFFDALIQKKGTYYGWGRKKSGLNAVHLASKHKTSFILLEDGFIRSLGLGVNGSPSFSLVKDDVGIYYDATASSKLENILNSYDFSADKKLMNDAKEAIALIKKHHISKYNNALDISKEMALKYHLQEEQKRVLVIAQTAGDASLKYGMLKNFSTDEIIESAINENRDSKVYIKIHPDVLSGKKKSDINIEKFRDKCTIITENINPISLLKNFSKIYTKTSGMGFEALLVGCECVCYGMPFYAGWGITDDRTVCKRRKRELSVEEIFAGAYILYTSYTNPYTKQKLDIIATIQSIIKLKGN
jgi:capsular polysaccharide export protein